MEQRVNVITLGMTRRLAIAAVAIGLPLLSADAAMACSCVRPNAPKLLRESDGAFIGRLLAVRPVDPPADGEPIDSGDQADYIYRVGRVFKRGPGLHRGRRVRVRSPLGSATCGLPSGRGRLYGLFLERSNRRWHSNLCQVVTPAQMRRAAEDASPSRAASPGGAGCG